MDRPPVSAAPAVLLRDEYGEPIMTLVERDRDGRLCRPWFAYLWVPAASPRPAPAAWTPWTRRSAPPTPPPSPADTPD